MEEQTPTQNSIKSVAINLFNGIFSQTINFNNGLNIIAGTNGTGKTHLLTYILQQRDSADITFTLPDKPKDIAAFSPKRNAEKILAEQAYNIIRQDPNARRSTLNAVKNINIQDDNYQTIKPISVYLASKAQELVDTNTQIVTAYEKVQKEYEELLQKIFNYTLSFTWNIETKKPNPLVIGKKKHNLSPQQLSSGENALISLFFAIFDAKDEVPIYLIDEPEVHLNWQLEEKLFQALDWFCQEYKKQIIIVTHSRTCFIEPYLNKTQFLDWEEDKIIVKNKPTEEIRKNLAGDIVKIIAGITIENKIVHVEDEAQENVLIKIKELLNKSLEVTRINGCDEVKKYSKVFKKLGITNAYFLIDGDNKKINQPENYYNLIQLKKYCIENYFLDETILFNIDKRTEKSKDIKTLINEAIKQVSEPNFKSFKKLINAGIDLDSEILETLDASMFLKKFLVPSLGFSDRNTFFQSYLEYLKTNNLLEIHFKEFYEELFN